MPLISIDSEPVAEHEEEEPNHRRWWICPQKAAGILQEDAAEIMCKPVWRFHNLIWTTLAANRQTG
jgi:hypothetical protein